MVRLGEVEWDCLCLVCCVVFGYVDCCNGCVCVCYVLIGDCEGGVVIG